MHVMEQRTANDVPSSAGRDLRSRRKAAGFSQRTLAHMSRCSPAAVRMLEQGMQPRHSPARERIELALAEFERVRKEGRELPSDWQVPLPQFAAIAAALSPWEPPS